MRGNQLAINQRVLVHPENPIKEDRGGISAQKIIEVIEDEYWDEWKRKLNFCHTSCIYARKLGNFYLGFSQLKGYTRFIIKNIRKLRVAIVKYREVGRKGALDKVVELERKLVLQLKAAWSQIEEQRVLFILRTIKWNKKLVERGTPERIKSHYERFEWSFVK